MIEQRQQQQHVVVVGVVMSDGFFREGVLIIFE
jgi:hypothetical protein